MFRKSSNPSTPELSLNSPWSRRSSGLGSPSPDDDSVSSDHSKRLSMFKKNPLKSIKKLSLKSDDDIDTKDYFPASPNVKLDGDYNSSNQNRTALPFKTPSLSLPKLRPTDNLSIGLENMPYAIYELQKYGMAGNVKTLAFDPVQSLMAVVTEYNHVYIFGQARVAVTLKIRTVNSIRALRFIKGIYLVAIDNLNTIFVISLQQKKVIHTIVSKLPITAFTMDYSLEFVFVGLRNGSVKAFNIESGMETILNLREQQKPVFPMASNSDVSSIMIHPRDIGTLLISYPKVTIIYNLLENRVMHNLVYNLPKTATGGENALYDYDTKGDYYPKLLHCLWHPNGLHVLTIHDDNSIVFWDAKTGQRILARSLFESHIDEPTGKPQKISRNKMTNIKKISWLCEADPEKTSLLILGGDGYSSDGYHQLVRMNFGKMISYSLTSYNQMANYYSQPKEQRIFAIHSKANIVDFVPLGEESPYFDGGHNPQLIAVVMSDGAIKFLHYPAGNLSLKAKHFPATVSWLNPKITCSSSSYMDRRILNGMTTISKPNELPDSVLKGGIPCRPKYKADSGSLIITGHECGFIRLWNSSEGDLNSSQVFEIDISGILQKDDEEVSISKISFALEVVELSCSLYNGDILLFSYQMNKNYQPKLDNLNSRLGSLSAMNSGHALINISDRAPIDVRRGFMPKLLIRALDNGSVTALCNSNIGFVAIGYEKGRLLIIDRRTGSAVYNEILRDNGLTLPICATSIEFGYGLSSGSGGRCVILMYIGTSIGRLLTYEISGDFTKGRYVFKFLEQVDCNDDSIVDIIVVNSNTGRPSGPTRESLKSLSGGPSERMFPYVITSSRSDIRVIKNNSKVAHKSYSKGDVSKIGITGAKTPMNKNVSFCLVVILGNSKTLLCLSIPSLVELSSLRIPYRMEPKFATQSSILPLGDVFLRITETEAALVNVMKIRTPIMSLETGQAADTLFLKNIVVPWRPGLNSMLKNTPHITYPDLYHLLVGKERPSVTKDEEFSLSWDISCYNPSNYTYVGSIKPVYYNPNAVHQNPKLMQAPRHLSEAPTTPRDKSGGWLSGITQYTQSTLDSAQDQVDTYFSDMNDDIDKMISEAKDDAIKGLLGGKMI